MRFRKSFLKKLTQKWLCTEISYTKAKPEIMTLSVMSLVSLGMLGHYYNILKLTNV